LAGKRKISIEQGMRRVLFCTIALLLVSGCTQNNPSPEKIREQTAKATSETVRDAKAVAKGVADGLKQNHGPVDINHATADQLQSLPGIDAEDAQRIISNRPYHDASDLQKRHLLSKTKYEQVSGNIVAQ
jgi:DNA uptake protein ComE-like DNA-binding protein